MQIVTKTCRGVRFTGGHQFWSNPLMADQEASIPVVLSNPTFLDLLHIIKAFGYSKVVAANRHLFDAKLISARAFHRNADTIESCQNGIARQA